MNSMKKILVLINPQSGSSDSVADAIVAIRDAWASDDIDLKFQFTTSPEDGRKRTQAAVKSGVDTILVVGGDGAVNAIGSTLIGTAVRLGVIPTGSGNGFARHFGIPRKLHDAAKQLRHGQTQRIDIGRINKIPFLVTASCAWEVDIAENFEAMPMRGILPYVVSAVYGAFNYTPQPLRLTLDDNPPMMIENPMLCTVANLTQYGGGLKIAPTAQPDDGLLELVVMEHAHLPALLKNLTNLLGDAPEIIPELSPRSFRSLRIEREQPSAIQIDGELVEAEATLLIDILPNSLNVIVPQSSIN